MSTLLQDIRFAIRTMLKNRGFTAVVVLTMALGIGANTAIFSVVDTVLLRPLPFSQPDRLMYLSQANSKMPDVGEGGVSYPNLFDWKKHSKNFDSMATYHDNDFILTGLSEPLHLSGEMVSSEFFSVLGQQPMLGRGFRPEENSAGNDAVVLSYELWKSRFGSDKGIVGRQVSLDSHPYNVVGVMPEAFSFPERTPAPDLWTSIAQDAFSKEEGSAYTQQRGAILTEAIGRLKPDVTPEQAKAELASFARSLAQQYPESNSKSDSVLVKPMQEQIVGDSRPLLTMLLGAVAFVLLIACANTANLLLARAASRQNEVAVRSALGASRSRIVQQLLTESILLSLAGAALGLMFARYGIQLIQKQAPDLPRISQVGLNADVLLFTFAVALVTGLIFGLVPAVQVARPNVLAMLRSGSRSMTGSNGPARTREVLIVIETALGLVLLVGAGLLLRSLTNMLHYDPGFDARNVLTFRVDVPSGRYSDEQQLRFYKQLIPRLQQVPGVHSASGVFPLPLSGGGGIVISMHTEDHQMPRGQRPSVNLMTASPDYFTTMGIRLEKGRAFTERDDEKAPPVMLVNETFAKKYYPGGNAIGKRVEIGMKSSLYKSDTNWREIVGVVADVKQRGLAIPVPPQAYIPYPQGFFGTLNMTVKTAPGAAGMADAIRHEIAAMDDSLPVYSIRGMNTYLSESAAVPRFHTTLLTLFAGLALVLAAVGLYGVMSYMVVQRTRDIGVRIALGAAPGNITRMVLGKGLILSGIGVAVGSAVALVLTRFMKTFLYGVQPLDPATFASVIALLVGVATLSSYIPARRAASVDPIVALRAD